MKYNSDNKIVFVILHESEYNLQELLEPYKLVDSELIVIIDNKLTNKEKDYLISIIKERVDNKLTSLVWKECTKQVKITNVLMSLSMKRYLLSLRKCNEINLKIISNDYELLDNEIFSNLGEWW